jgi:hypothetical protein
VKLHAGPVAELEPGEAARLLVAARRGTGPLRASQGCLPAGVDQVLEVLASPAPVLDGPACAVVVALVRAAENAGILGGLNVTAEVRQLVDVVADHRARIGFAADRLAAGLSRDNIDSPPLTPGSWISTVNAGRALKLDPSYLRRQAAKGAIEARRTGRGGWMLRAESVSAWNAERRHGRTTEAA